MAMGDLKFYGKENGERNGNVRPYTRAHESEAAKDDPFALHMAKNEQLKGCIWMQSMKMRTIEIRTSSEMGLVSTTLWA